MRDSKANMLAGLGTAAEAALAEMLAEMKSLFENTTRTQPLAEAVGRRRPSSNPQDAEIAQWNAKVEAKKAARSARRKAERATRYK